MTRKLLFGLLGVTLMAALVGTPAMAHHAGSKGTPSPHLQPPEDPESGLLEALCTVDGEVTTNNAVSNGGVSADQPNHNHYEFVDAALECTDVKPGNGVDSGGVFAVEARGASDSCAAFDPTSPPAVHGETALEGCGDGALAPPVCTPNFTLGGLAAVRTTPPDGATILGEVDFKRNGSVVDAYGELCGDLGDGCFDADLNFTPNDPNDAVDRKVNTAALHGVARVMLEKSDGDCGPGAPGSDS